MFIVGIDIAKRSHEAVVISASGDVLVKSFKFSNDSKGFDKLLKNISAINADLSQFEFGMEATGHYWLNLYCKLIDLKCLVHVINPVQSDALRGLYIRQTKNDSKDSFLIAELIRFGRYAETTLSDPDTIALRELTRQRFYLVDCISDTKRKVICLIDKIFPEYENIFGCFSAVMVILMFCIVTSLKMFLLISHENGLPQPPKLKFFLISHRFFLICSVLPEMKRRTL